MRDILFKAKRLDNGEWVYWNIWGELLRESGKRTRVAVKKGATTSYYDYIYQIAHLIDQFTICRYTGLTDKNGQKIWENDVFKHYNRTSQDDFESYEIGLVTWDDSRCRFTNYDIIRKEHYVLNGVCVYEVIGNIFDNPELLKGGE